jgi:2-polyprenyl-6-hydroxyphenyl methylase/3-demethylubiquinone-9 3-methyltransferase
VRARHLLAPLDRIASYVPPVGQVLDVGCGHGLFACALALEAPRRGVRGVDPSAAKIAVARAVSGHLPNLRFQQGTLEQVAGGPVDVITILDVLYLLPPADKRALLGRCRALLGPDGLLLLKTNDTAPAWKFAVTRAQEAAMTGLGLTMGRGLHFFSQRQHLELLRAVGFDAYVVRLDGWWPYPHRLFVCRPAAERP